MEPNPAPSPAPEAPRLQVVESERQTPRQGALFQTSRFPQLVERPAAGAKPVSAPAPRRLKRLPSSPPAGTRHVRRGAATQGRLEFVEEAAPPTHASPDHARSSVQHGTRLAVARPTHRMVAGFIDLSLVLIAFGILVSLPAYRLGSQWIFTRATLPLCALALVLVGLFYMLFWAVLKGVTPGMRFTRLRLVSACSSEPSQSQRIVRAMTTCLSLAAVGMGVAWMFVDDEHLTWQDHISNTYPSPAR